MRKRSAVEPLIRDTLNKGHPLKKTLSYLGPNYSLSYIALFFTTEEGQPLHKGQNGWSQSVFGQRLAPLLYYSHRAGRDELVHISLSSGQAVAGQHNLLKLHHILTHISTNITCMKTKIVLGRRFKKRTYLVYYPLISVEPPMFVHPLTLSLKKIGASH